MKKCLVALAFGTLGLGMSEFGMMGILTFVASGLHVSIPQAGHLVSAYALGVCIGAPLTVAVAHTRPLKQILLALAGLMVAGNLCAAFAPNYGVLLAMRFVSGLPHGAYFGVAAIVAADAAEAAEKAAHIVGLLPANNLTGPAIFEFEQPTSVLSAGAAPEKAAAALIDKDSAVELYAGFGKHVYTAFATIGGNAVGIVATGETLCHNCVAKASRFVRLCDAFSVPVLTIVNTNGFAPSTTDDIAGGIRVAARLAATYAAATTAKVALLSGKAVGPVYTALANADLKIAVNGCTVSALEPNAAVSVLYKAEIDASDNIIAATNAKAAQYTAEVCSAANAVAAGAADMTCDAANARASVVAAFELLSTKRAARLPKKHGNMAL